MGTKSAIPTRDYEEKTVTRAGWPIGDDEPMPGDTIRWPPALGDQRGAEQGSVADDIDSYAEQPLRVEPLPDDEYDAPEDTSDGDLCAFCNPQHSVDYRGPIGADYKLVTEDGDVVALTCHACIREAPILDEGSYSET